MVTQRTRLLVLAWIALAGWAFAMVQGCQGPRGLHTPEHRLLDEQLRQQETAADRAGLPPGFYLDGQYFDPPTEPGSFKREPNPDGKMGPWRWVPASEAPE